MNVFKVNSLNQLGSLLEIIKFFGGKSEHKQVLVGLENKIYRVV